MSDGRVATLPTLLFQHPGHAFAQLLRFLVEFSMVLCRIKDVVYGQERKALAFEMTFVACTFLSTLGLFAAAYYNPKVGRSVHYFAIAILVFSWGLTITVIFEVIDDTLACFSGLSGRTDAAFCFVAQGRTRRQRMVMYWIQFHNLFFQAILDVLGSLQTERFAYGYDYDVAL
ncbi:unnamed protein product [Clonostachys solani]|uniref:MARVEL domain-containing protein n=1 Tax=Clonostachys solani TaxID=160281 RepID=A0A9P0ET56_9HYPO|nr:unnamed protein product [Clonostachys solani]